MAVGFSAREIRQLFQGTEFFCKSFTDQLCFPRQYAQESLDTPIQKKELAIPFK
jgi:hypothetical protein